MTPEPRPAGPLLPILFVNFHGSIGGGQMHLLAILKGLDRTRFSAELVCCKDGPFLDTLRALGFDPILIPFGNGKLRHLSQSVPAIFKMFRLLKRKGIRLVHVGGLQEAKLAAWPAAWAKIPLVWVVAP